MPRATGSAQHEVAAEPVISVDPAVPVMFAQSEQFTTTKGSYRNLIFRIHFAQVPWQWGDFHFTAGKNVGLLVIVTLNQQGRPLLLTTVHTCGCYLAFFPWADIPRDYLPHDWPQHQQRVYGITLPAFLGAQKNNVSNSNEKLLITLEGGSHRVRDVQLVAAEQISSHYRRHEMALVPMAELDHLPYGSGREISFFETRGSRRGYVRNCTKPLEQLLMSWWTLDWYIGVDKAYGESTATGALFYTNLKFWRRTESDMWNFTQFLNYWGWNF